MASLQPSSHFEGMICQVSFQRSNTLNVILLPFCSNFVTQIKHFEILLFLNVINVALTTALFKMAVPDLNFVILDKGIDITLITQVGKLNF